MKLSHTITCAFAVAFAWSCLPSVAADEEASEQAQPAAVDPELKEELEFIKALVEDGMPDLATPVIDAAKKKWPNAAPKLKVYEMQSFLSQGKFDVVQKEVDALKGKKERESEYWALRLSMADAYYAGGMMPECQKIYGEFFKTITKPGADLLDFYVESGFRWAQICTREKKYDEAVGVFRNLLATLSDKDSRWGNVALEAVELLLRLADDIPADTKDKAAKAKRAEYLNLTMKWVDKLLWKRDQALVFGKAIAMKAHIEMLRGKYVEAQSLVSNYMSDLSDIHSQIMEADPDGTKGYVRASPMPECRYLLAKMLWDVVRDEAKKPKANEDLIKDSLFGARDVKTKKRTGLGAYNHALNVYVKYSDSAWAADAADLAEEIEAFVKERYKKDIRPKNIPPELADKARKMRFKNAYELFHGQEYEKAVAAYEAILASAPESVETVNARGVQAECCVNLRQNAKKGSPEQAKYEKAAAEAEDFVVTQYKGKSEAITKAAGDQTLRLAALEHDLGKRARARELYDAYFANYPEHYRAAQMADVLARQAYKEEDWESAIKFFTILVEKYPKSESVVDAYKFLAVCNEKLGKVEEQKKWFGEYVKNEKKTGARTAVQLGLALMQQKQAFAAFDAADATNDVAAAEAMRKEAFRSVTGSIKDFRAVSGDLTKTLETEGKSLDAKERDLFLLRREQAIFLEAASWQRLMKYAEGENVPKFRGLAIKAYEKYLDAYPKGQYAPQSLVKIGTIYTAESKRASDGNDAALAGECMKKSQDAFARLQKDFPDSDEAKNSLPRLAKTLIDMGMAREGAAEYRKMLEAENGKYTAGQFLQAGQALLAAKQWQDADDAYAKAIELATPLTNSVAYLAPALMGQAQSAKGAKNYAEARQRLDEFIEKYNRSSFVTNAYDMLVDVSLEMGGNEKDEVLRSQAFNTAFGALKKLRPFREAPCNLVRAELEKIEAGHNANDAGKTMDALWTTHAQMRKAQEELDNLDLRSCKVLLAKLKAELDRPDEAAKTRRRAIVALSAFLMAHDPFTFEGEKKTFKRRADKFVAFADEGNVPAHVSKKLLTKEEFANLGKQEDRENLLSPKQIASIEFCYGKLLPLMVEQGLGRQEVEPYFDRYMEFFGPNGAAGKGDHYGDVEDVRSKVKGN